MKKCTSCGNDLIFNPKSHSLYCKSCSRDEIIDTLIKKDIKNNYSESEESNYVNYSCDCVGCGNKLVFDEKSVTFECPYCGKSAILDEFKYDIMGVIPFKFGSDEVAFYYKTWVKSKFWAPKAFKKESFVNNFSGHYLPCYVYDTYSSTVFSGQYKIVKRRTVGSGKNRRTETYVTYRPFSGKRNDKLEDTMVIGSNTVSNYTLEMIEPYNYDLIEEYNEHLLYGYIVDNYIYGNKDAFKNAKVEIENKIRSFIYREAPHTISSLNMNVQHTNIKFARYLLPLYSCQSMYKSKTYSFYVNGQTGKVYGNTPVSRLKVFIAVSLGIILAVLIFIMIYL